MTTPQLELGSRTNSTSDRQQQSEQQTTTGTSLPPADGGKDAWLFLTGAFVIEGFVWGYAFSFGIFQQYYTGLELSQGQQTQIPIIGTTSTGIMYLCSPVALPLMRSYPHRRRQGMVAGLVVSSIAYIGASFARNVQHLILTQGVLAGVGLSLTYYPVFSFIDEWFVRRKGFAYGIAWAASGLFGLILPYFFSWLLDRYSFRTMLRVWAAVSLTLISLPLKVLKPRRPYAQTVRFSRPRLSFAKSILFIVFCTSNAVVSMGYFLPGIYLPSYARSLGFSNSVATSSVSVLNIGTFLGFICGGFLADRWPSNAMVCYSTVGTTLTVVLLWGLSSNVAVLISFALLYSFFGACFTTTWAGLTRDFVRKDVTRTAEPAIVYAFFIAGRGVGNLVSGPLSQALLHIPRLTERFTFGYGSSFGALVVFTAVTAVLGGLGPLCNAAGMT